MKRTTRWIGHGIALTLLALFTMGAYASCEVDTPGVSVGYHVDVDPVHLHATSGDLSIDYSLGGWGCGKANVVEVSYVLLDRGAILAEDHGLTCNTLSSLIFPTLPWGSYQLEVRGYDSHGQLIYLFNGSIVHDALDTRVRVELSPY
ncbi:MAG: hypothetical protein KC609_04570 [Myxococcales bacterium]|nr:hypothetical protein [Myxococcales bacterium]